MRICTGEISYDLARGVWSNGVLLNLHGWACPNLELHNEESRSAEVFDLCS
jgi:hypothetical protein